MDIKVKPETSGMQELRELEILFGTYELYRVSVNNATQYIKFLRVILRLGIMPGTESMNVSKRDCRKSKKEKIIAFSFTLTWLRALANMFDL